jgi:thymidylate kinase
MGLSPQTAVAAVRTSCDPGPSQSDRHVPDFFDFFLRQLDEVGVRYCILHSWEKLPAQPESDVDMAVHREDREKLAEVFRRLEEQNYLAVQCLNYSVNAFYFVFCWFDQNHLRTIALDVMFEHWRSGLTVPEQTALLAERDQFRDTWIPSVRDQFAYALAKQTWKGKANQAQSERLQGLAQHLGRPQVRAIAGEMFLAPWNRRVVDACFDGSIGNLLVKVRLYPWLTSLVRQPLVLSKHVLQQARRIARRWVRPTGLLVAIIGPDGAGKDTVIAGLCDGVRTAFRRIHKYHWRPHVLFPRKDAPAVTDPHAKSARGPMLSSLYLLFFVFDYWIGYALRVRPALARGTLVIFDRYFYDVIVDPKRARFGGPKWLPGLLARLVPGPDLILLLDADAQVMFARKGELSVAELDRQRQAYRDMSVGAALRTVVSTNQTVEQSIADANRAVVEFLHLRFAIQNADWICARAAAVPRV